MMRAFISGALTVLVTASASDPFDPVDFYLDALRELGADEEALHADWGARARAAGLRRLYTLGPLSAAAAAAFGEGAHSFQDHASLAAALRADLRAGVRCLVKGSRGSAMDRIVAALLSTGEDTPHVA